MKNVLAVLCLCVGWMPLLAGEATDAIDGTRVSSQITDVTVYADRAQVIRSAGIDLAETPARFVFAQLPGWIDEGSVRVSLLPAEAGQILDVQIHRTYLAKADNEEFRKAELAVREIADQIAALGDEKGVLEAQAKQVDSIRGFSLEKLPKDMAVREIKPAEYGESVKFVANSLREIATGKRDLERKLRDLQPELQVRQRKLEELRQRAQLEQRTVVVTARGGVHKAQLRLSYLLPGATWEPVHELRATPDGKTVALSSYAVVMQTTGEDWSRVQLALSSQRSTETLKIPELDALLLGTGRRISHVVSSSADSFYKANKTFESQNSFYYAINNPDAALQTEYRENGIAMAGNARKVGQLFETLRERGTTAHFPASAPQTIRADGRAVRVPIGLVELSAQHRILAAPELSFNAAHTVDLSNTGKQALLPGKVLLYLDGAFLGMTETDFVAPGETFSLYLGVADEIKLARTLDKKRSELKRAGQRTRVQASFLVSVENLSSHPVAVQLAERVPVSESDEIRVSGVRIQPEGKPDAKGLLRWDLSLAPKQSKEFRIEYTIEYPNELPERLKAPSVSKEMGLPAPAPAMDALHEQIRSLERKF